MFVRSGILQEIYEKTWVCGGCWFLQVLMVTFYNQFWFASTWMVEFQLNNLNNTVVSRKYAPPFCNLSLSTKRRGGLYTGSDIFSRDYAIYSGAPPTTLCPGRRRQRIWRLCGCCWEGYLYMWQSHVEIERYSVVYFDRIATPYRWTSVKGGAHTMANEPRLSELQRCDQNTRRNNLR